MVIKDILELLRENTYPGRGIVIGRSDDGSKGIIAYFIMGRSENSRNRVFALTDDGIKTQAHDPAKMTDPSLVIYNPVRRVQIGENTIHIVTNGDQTDTIRDFMLDGKSYTDALSTRTFEPDAPNNTPRISGMLFPGGSYMLSILKSLDDAADNTLRQYFNFDTPRAGTGHFVHTYVSDGDPLPPFEGEPTWVQLPNGDINAQADAIWDAMNTEHKVSLYVSQVDIESGSEDYSIIKNKNSGD